MEAWRQYRVFHPPSDIGAYVKEEEGTTYVDFEPADPANPKNWSTAYKSIVVAQLSFLTLSLTYASSASSSAEKGMMEEFGCNQVVATASTGLFLLGMGIGAMPFAPLSECTY
jgi:DHA1 family multidrug resistance protein-like MFS transporter